MYPATAAAGGVALAVVLAEREKEEPEQPERYNVSASAIQSPGVAAPEYAYRADLSLDMASTSKNDGWQVKGKRVSKNGWSVSSTLPVVKTVVISCVLPFRFPVSHPTYKGMRNRQVEGDTAIRNCWPAARCEESAAPGFCNRRAFLVVLQMQRNQWGFWSLRDDHHCHSSIFLAFSTSSAKADQCLGWTALCTGAILRGAGGGLLCARGGGVSESRWATKSQEDRQ
jgi:hypothetical protein